MGKNIDVTNPRYNEPNSPVPWHLVKSRFHLNYSVCRILKEESTPRMVVFLSRIPPSRANQNLHHDSMAQFEKIPRPNIDFNKREPPFNELPSDWGNWIVKSRVP